jgi:hypothetical protein
MPAVPEHDPISQAGDYGTRLHQQQLYEGEDYTELRPTISIRFLDHVMFPKAPAYHLRFRLLEESLHFPFTEAVEFYILELPNSRNPWKS